MKSWEKIIEFIHNERNWRLFRIIVSIVLFLFGEYYLRKGYREYENLMLVSDKIPVSELHITSSDYIIIESLKFYIDHNALRNDDHILVYLEMEIKGQFEYLSIHLPWKINSTSLAKNAVFGKETYNIDSTGNLLVFGEKGKDSCLLNFILSTKSSLKTAFSESTFNFPIYTAFSAGMPYAESREFMEKIVEPKICYMEVIYSMPENSGMGNTFPQPDAIINREKSKELRWWFNPDKNKFISSLQVTYFDEKMKIEANRIAFRSGIYLSIGFSILFGLIMMFLGTIKSR